LSTTNSARFNKQTKQKSNLLHKNRKPI